MSEDNKKVRRCPDVPVPEMNEERRKELSNRTVYAKGFPKDATLDDLLKHFKQYDHVENIIMRKFQERSSKKRMFKGSIFITFKTREQVIISFYKFIYLFPKRQNYIDTFHKSHNPQYH